MLSLLLLASAPMSTSGIVPKEPLSPPSATQIAGAVPLAERARGARVIDQVGSPLGIVDQSDANMVVVLVGNHKVQLPANAFRKVAGQLILPVTAQQLEQLLATSAAFQEQTNPMPAPVQPPKGFKPLSTVGK